MRAGRIAAGAFTAIFTAIIVACLAAPAAAQDMEQWEDYLKRGAAAYDAADYQTALLLYGKALEIIDAPKLRLQVADIHEKLEECNAARLVYASILDNEGAEVEVHRVAAAGLDRLGECRAPRGLAPEETPERTVQVAAEVPSPRKRLPPGRKRAGYVLLGVSGLTLVGAGVATSGVFIPRDVKECLGVGGVARCDSYRDRLGESRAPTFLAASEQANLVVRRHRVLAISLLGASAVGLVTGSILLLTGKTLPVAILPTHQGVQVFAEF